MARDTVEDCLDNVDNRFQMVMNATRRARQLAKGFVLFGLLLRDTRVFQNMRYAVFDVL